MAKLTAAQVKHAKQGRHGDGRGLYLQVIGGSKTWLLRYKHQRRERWMGLGSVEFVTLAEAREQAFQLRCKLKREKIDPLEARRALQVGARLAALNGATFEQVARQYVEVRAMAKKWRGDVSRREWLSTLAVEPQQVVLGEAEAADGCDRSRASARAGCPLTR
jgi:hypothetical protein